ncbi:hypothetical protein diail_11549 [Diaporthe ilicicola]|nr:hypothetical protein diail_11549 [Diaporthe ilicicola]
MEYQHQNQASSLPEDGSILLHIFSQGGSNIATQLLESTNAVLSTLGHQGPLPLRQIVFDSCPGDPGIHSSCAAGAISLPDVSVLRLLGGAVLYIFVIGIAGMEAAGLRASLARTMRSQFNDPEIFSARAARLYLTSEADQVIDSRDIEEHRNQAVARGLMTDILRFHQAGHCSLVLEDNAAYWNAIVAGWERSAAPENAQVIGHCGDSGALDPSSKSGV